MKSVCSTENDSKVGNMIAAQCRAGRGLINMTVKELAARARVATDTIVRLEWRRVETTNRRRHSRCALGRGSRVSSGWRREAKGVKGGPVD